MKFDFNAHQQLSDSPCLKIQEAIQIADRKSKLGIMKVCKTNAGEILVLPEYSAQMRQDIAEIVYDTENGFSFPSAMQG